MIKRKRYNKFAWENKKRRDSQLSIRMKRDFPEWRKHHKKFKVEKNYTQEFHIDKIK